MDALNNPEIMRTALCMFLAGAAFISFVFFICKGKMKFFSQREELSNLEGELSAIAKKKEQLAEEEASYRASLESKKKAFRTMTRKVRERQKEYDALGKRLVERQGEYAQEEEKQRQKLAALSHEFASLDERTKELQTLERNVQEIERKLAEWPSIKEDFEKDVEKLHAIQAKIDLYSQLEEFTECGAYCEPNYIYNTLERYAIEIEKIRDQQKELIRNDSVIVGPNSPYGERLGFMGKLLSGQKKLALKAFNIECEFLIAKVNPGNFDRILKRMGQMANSLEKLMADLRWGISDEYLQLKMQECKLQFESEMLKKQQADEERALREQMREELKVKKEYERELLAAEKEERKYVDLIESAKKSLLTASGAALEKAELRIAQLEAQLAEAVARAERAKSMAEQTKCGHVYIISNIGSFGEDVYKIGLTRRLDPTERVRELGDASVPFAFDTHAMIASDNAPALEHALHCAFNDRRVNAVNTRKEFFRVSLEEIREKACELTGGKADFIMTKKAEEYYQTKRLQHS